MRVPKYRRHTLRDFAFVEVDGKRIRLPGLYNSAESRDAYAGILKRVLADEYQPGPPVDVEQVVTVNIVLSAYLDFARRHYEGSGPQGEYANLRYAIKHLAGYGSYAATSFGPLMLKEAQRRMADAGKSRGYINQVTAKVKRAFKWAVSEELIPVGIYQALATVPGLQAGRTAAKERRKKTPVEWRHVEAILPRLPASVAAMVQVQWHTGARSDSVCMATRRQFDREGPLWLWRPKHKNEFRGVDLVLPIGPRCQKILGPILDAANDDAAFLFNPRDVRPNRRYRTRYSTHSYRQAIQRAIDKVNELEAETAAKESREPNIVPAWSPHQLRHAKGHAVRNQFGLEAAQAVLGHESVNATQIYSARRLELAKQVASETG